MALIPEDAGAGLEEHDGGFEEAEEDAGLLVPLEQEPTGTPEDGVTVPATKDPAGAHTGCSASPAGPLAIGAALLAALRRRRAGIAS